MKPFIYSHRHFPRRTVLLAAAFLFATSAQAQSFFSQYGKGCPVGYGCIYDLRSSEPNSFSQGIDIPAGNSGWYNLPYRFAGNTNEVRNRNATTGRSVVIRNADNRCLALRYDDRTWVSVGGAFTAQSMRATTTSRPSGSTTNVSGCTSTRWL